MPAKTFWFTGLPCSGKSTLARALAAELSVRGIRCEVLDGDVLRRTISNDLGFSKEDRDKNIERVAHVASMLNRHGVVAIVALVSPYRAARQKAKEIVGSDFVEVFVRAPLETCIKRDVKGMYAKAMRNEITEFTGVSDPYEDPLEPDLILDTTAVQESEAVLHLLSAFSAE